jgi:hypothetical protein
MQAICSSETSSFLRTTRYYNTQNLLTLLAIEMRFLVGSARSVIRILSCTGLEDNIKIYLRERGYEFTDFGDFQTLVNTILNLRASLKAGNFLTAWATSRFSRLSVSSYTFIDPAMITQTYIRNRLIDRGSSNQLFNISCIYRVQTGSGAQPASYSISIGERFVPGYTVLHTNREPCASWVMFLEWIVSNCTERTVL